MSPENGAERPSSQENGTSASHPSSVAWEAGPPNADELDVHSLAFVEERFASYLRDPQSVGADWQHYFERLRNGQKAAWTSPPEEIFPSRSLFHRGVSASGTTGSGTVVENALLQERADRLVHAYRVRGHIISRVDPLNQPRPEPPELSPAFHGLTEADLDRHVAGPSGNRADVRPLRRIIQQMRNTYCRCIGVQYMHIDDLSVRKWLQQRMESTENRLKLPRDEQLRILTRLTHAVVFEEFLQRKYVGAKSFSLEGGESLIPLMDLLIERAGDQGTDEIVVGMAHRGRLNVLANIIGKPPRDIFREFEDVDGERNLGRGDVKYHLGHSSDWTTSSGHKVHLSLCFNPSHLEFVNPVAMGRMRAKQDRFGDTARSNGLVLQIHGDAAFAGEGVIQETLNLSELQGYSVGGAIHVVVNNQIGFTTRPPEGRSCIYATDVAKMLQSPIFHVNGEDPEAVAQTVQLALDFRREFQRDVVIDMYCYRRRGHNEGDEPAFTQPLMYRAIEQCDTVRDNYLDRLLLLGEITYDEADRIVRERRDYLENELNFARSKSYVPPSDLPAGIWAGYTGGQEPAKGDPQTGVDKARLAELMKSLALLPDDFHPHPKIARFLKLREEMAAGTRPLDWAAGEALALASLATEGVRVRLTGQDTERGTFSQRHAVLHDIVDDHTCTPLTNLTPDQAPVELCNSPLSETGVLGFEYGYSLDCPDGLVMWEAQFGDFVNAAQVIIDQFIASGESKWRRLSGVVLLLPHGFEGQGPEHSSARLERFLSLAAEDNLQIVTPTTPAQYFHLLRRQGLWKWRKPLVVMTPKSLLRHPVVVSSLDDVAGKTFQRVLADVQCPSAKRTRRIILCGGKVYYEIAQRRADLKRDDVAILRIEQLYPLPTESLKAALAGYAAGTPVVWVQEEPENMGAWRFLRCQFGESLLGRFPFRGISRPAAASPAGGSAASHKMEQEKLLAAAFEGL